MKPSNSIPRSLSIAHGKFSLAPGRSYNKRVIINVGGVRYETFKSTLRTIPDTRLSWLTEAHGHNPDYDPATGEFFFDRHPAVFNMILNYYRTGKLHAPTDVCGPLFEEELAFWGIDEKQIEPCCWGAYRAHRDAQETLAEFDSDHGSDDSDDDRERREAEEAEEEMARRFGIVPELPGSQSWGRRGDAAGCGVAGRGRDGDGGGGSRQWCKGCWGGGGGGRGGGGGWVRYRRWQPRVWHLLEDPKSSSAAKVVAVVSVIFVLLYIAIFVAESHVVFRDVRTDVNVTWSEAMTVREEQRATTPKPWLVALEYTCVVYFTLELVVRTLFCPDRRAHCRHLMTWVDVLSLLPSYVSEVALLADPSLKDSAGLYVLRSVRVVRIFRILRLTRYFSGLKILGHTLKASAKELLLMILVLGIGVLVFACFIYYVEQVEEGERNDFRNIPIGFWWAVVTMTTLGYGDMYPRTALGYLVGAICALCGLLMLALPVPVIVNNFTLYYSHAQAKLKLPHKRKNVLVGAADALKTDAVGASGSLDDVRWPSGGEEMMVTVPNEGQEGGGSQSSMDSRGAGSQVGGRGIGVGVRGGGVEGGKEMVCRKASDDDSVQESVDSGFKTGSASTNGRAGDTGISVIFTDEVATVSSPTSSPTLPAPSSQRRGHPHPHPSLSSSSSSPSSRLAPSSGLPSPTTTPPTTATHGSRPNPHPNHNCVPRGGSAVAPGAVLPEAAGETRGSRVGGERGGGAGGLGRRLSDKRNSIHAGLSRKGTAASFRRRSMRPTGHMRVDIVDVEV